METVLCFGDSNTWGYIPGSGERYSEKVRWTGIFQKNLELMVKVVEDGLNGRTTVWEDPIEGDKCGLRHLMAALETNEHLDIIVLMLGTNDLKHRFSLTPFDIAAGAGRLVQTIREDGLKKGLSQGTPRILLVCPPVIGPLSGDIAMMFQHGIKKSSQLASYFSLVASEMNCDYFFAADVVKPSPLDGIHLDEEGHTILGAALAERVRRMIVKV